MSLGEPVDVKPTICDICQKAFTKKQEFVFHYEWHTRAGSSEINKTDCEYRFDVPTEDTGKKEGLKIYSGTSKCGKKREVDSYNVSPDKKNSDCGLFTQKSSRVIPVKKNFSCDLCIREFSNRGHFLVHYRRHQRETPQLLDDTLFLPLQTKKQKNATDIKICTGPDKSVKLKIYIIKPNP